jgi:hypothetical protein
VTQIYIIATSYARSFFLNPLQDHVFHLSGFLSGMNRTLPLINKRSGEIATIRFSM